MSNISAQPSCWHRPFSMVSLFLRKEKRRGITVLILSLCLLLSSLSVSSVHAQNGPWTGGGLKVTRMSGTGSAQYAGGLFTITGNGVFEVTLSNGSNPSTTKIQFSGGQMDVTLKGVELKDNQISIESGANVTMTLDGSNSIKYLTRDGNPNVNSALDVKGSLTIKGSGMLECFYGEGSGIRVASGKTLTIESGTVRARCDSDPRSENIGFAGIELPAGATLVVNNGAVYAEGGNGALAGGAGIGSNAALTSSAVAWDGNAGGTVIVTGGSVEAVGGGGGDGPGGAGIGSGGSKNDSGSGGSVTVSGNGVVKATGGIGRTSGGAGIGSGGAENRSGAGGFLRIEGDGKVEAIGGEFDGAVGNTNGAGGAGVGSGGALNGVSGRGASLTVTSGRLTATGGDGGLDANPGFDIGSGGHGRNGAYGASNRVVLDSITGNPMNAVIDLKKYCIGKQPADLLLNNGTVTGTCLESAVYSGQYPVTAPSITAISPPSASASGGSTITVTGAGFVPGDTTVYVDGSLVAANVLSSDKLTFKLPAGTVGMVDVVVRTSKGPSNTLSFEYTGASGQPGSRPGIWFEFAESGYPRTGFPTRNRVSLRPQPSELAYSTLGLSIDIPILNVQSEIVNVPDDGTGWAVDWLASRTGLLEGSPLPGEGTSYIAAHNHLNTLEVGPFLFIRELEENDRLFILSEAGDLQEFSVYANLLVDQDTFETVYDEAERYPNALVLITCENEAIDGSYVNRRIVFAKPR